jgi:hypothetical protein
LALEFTCEHVTGHGPHLGDRNAHNWRMIAFESGFGKGRRMKAEGRMKIRRPRPLYLFCLHPSAFCLFFIRMHRRWRDRIFTSSRRFNRRRGLSRGCCRLGLD